MRSSILALHERESFAQSARLGTRFSGSFASSDCTSESVRPTRCANTMKATRRITGRW